jgi:hypothetical protein
VILRRDHIAGGLFVVAGIVLFAVSGDLPIGSMAMPGAGMLPKLIIGLMIVFGLMLTAQAHHSPPFATIAWDDLPHALCVRITMALMLFGLLVAVERQSLIRAALFSIGVPVGADLLFGTLLKSPLPRGLLGF